MAALTEHLGAGPIFPSNWFDFKEMFEAYILIDPRYLPAVEWTRANPKEALATGCQMTLTKSKKKQSSQKRCTCR